MTGVGGRQRGTIAEQWTCQHAPVVAHEVFENEHAVVGAPVAVPTQQQPQLAVLVILYDLSVHAAGSRHGSNAEWSDSHATRRDSTAISQPSRFATRKARRHDAPSPRHTPPAPRTAVATYVSYGNQHSGKHGREGTTSNGSNTRRCDARGCVFRTVPHLVVGRQHVLALQEERGRPCGVWNDVLRLHIRHTQAHAHGSGGGAHASLGPGEVSVTRSTAD